MAEEYTTPKQDITDIMNAAKDQVEARFNAAEAIVNQYNNMLPTALTNLTGALGNLSTQDVTITIDKPGDTPNYSDFTDNIPDIDVIEDSINNIISEIEGILEPTSPTLLGITPVVPETLPTAPGLPPDVITPIDPEDFTATPPVMEVINIIDTETAVSKLDDIISEDPMSEKPILDIITIEPIQPFNRIEFTDTLDDSDITYPYTTLSWTETPYTSTLKDAIQGYVLNVISSGGTGINSAVEDALFNRNIERENQILEDALLAATQEWSRNGFDMPDDDIIDRRDRLRIEFGMKRTDLSREIMIKAWELEQANVFKSIDKAVEYETQLIGLANNMATRSYECAKSVCEINIAICKIEIDRFNSRLLKFETKLKIWDTKHKSELAKLEFYNAYLKGVEIRVDIDKQKVELFAKLIAVYQSRIDAVKAIIQAKAEAFEFEKTKLEKFKAETQGFTALIGLKNAEYGWMTAKISGEEAKIRGYTAKVEAYKSLLLGISAKQGIAVENIKNIIAYDDGLLKKHSGEVDIYKAKVGIGVQKAEVGMKGMSVGAEVFSSVARGYQTIGGLKEKEWDANIQLAIAEAQIRQKNAEIEIKGTENMKTLLISTLDSIVKTLAQVISGAMAGTSAVAHITADGRASEELQYQHQTTENTSTSTQTQHIYNHDT